MAIYRVTMRDIADALGLSRNTVSKALNGNPAVPASTRNMVIQKAESLGYKNYVSSNQAQTGADGKGGTIAFFASVMPGKNHFGSQFLTGFTERMSRGSYTLSVYILRQEDIDAGRAPLNFSREHVSGILCIEMFDPSYCDFICAMNKPVLFAETYVIPAQRSLRADIMMMENRKSTESLAAYMIKKGAKSIGFIGDRNHCQGFAERWEGFCRALLHAGLSVNPARCVLDDNREPYNDSAWMTEKLRAMGELPEAFMCANDTLAISVLEALKTLGKSAPQDIMVAGFDNNLETQLLYPRLTTVHIPSYEMGIAAADTMLRRIECPGFPYTTTYIQTTPRFREST
ncbi:MAG: LacI family DNA-binding transcriptional regulator [Treponema sp.]|jgi:LacI family transcriptional regulator|nr:LacI family DNA-binding transcriptional regulator [Treponema sp.]